MDRVTRSHHIPTNPPCRKGCPAQLTPFYQTAEFPEGHRVALIHQYTTMRLVHLAKNGTMKSSLPLLHIHNELASKSLVLAGSGSSNILLSMVSFECLIKDSSGNEFRDHIRFDLKIPRTNTKGESVFSYEMVEKAYGGKSNLYAALKRLYTLGRSKVNPDKHKHGHCPDYDPASSTHDQYIRHTEQLLAAYLALPEGAQMLSDHLTGAIRAKHKNTIAVKIYNMGLHMHSTKTCCAPCEYTLLGLMNENREYRIGGKQWGFLLNFAKVAALGSEALQMRLPKKSLFRLLVTVTTSKEDAHHKTQPVYRLRKLERESVPFYDLEVKSAKITRSIFMTMVNTKYDQRRVPIFPELSGITVGISGSKETKGSPGTMDKVRSIRKKELEQFASLSLLID